MDNFTAASKASSNVDETTRFCSTSHKVFGIPQDEFIAKQRKDSSTHSSETAPYLENNENSSSSDSPPYLENEDVQLLTGTNMKKDLSLVKGPTGNATLVSPSSIMSSLHTSESSSFQGEGYVSEENAIMLAVSATNQSSYNNAHPKNKYQKNQNATKGFGKSPVDENISTSKNGEYISQIALELPEGSSSVDSDCINFFDNSPINV